MLPETKFLLRHPEFPPIIITGEKIKYFRLLKIQMGQYALRPVLKKCPPLVDIKPFIHP
jgi:hypothetical protein